VAERSKRFEDLSEPEILALAITNEEEDARIYREFAERLRADFPASTKLFEAMAAEEDEHRRRLLGLYESEFGGRLPFIRREHVSGFIERQPLWLLSPLRLEAVQDQAEQMEAEAMRFYQEAAARTRNVALRKLFGDLAEAEAGHERSARELTEEARAGEGGAAEQATRRRLLVLQVVQPGLAGLMDGSVSTLAPLFAAAFATHSSADAFLVGLAAAVGAGISMGFAEALSDDGVVSGRGRPLFRGLVSGFSTALGGLGHTLPFLIPAFATATALAIAVVVLELAAISWIRTRYMETPFLRASFQVVVGGALVFVVGILIGSA
jgi:rubrerythrin